MKMSFLFFTIILFLSPVHETQAAAKTKTFARKISVKMTFSGDLAEVYQFDGPLASRLLGETEKPNPVCENTSFFREALYNERRSLEVWIDLLCTIEGQKKQFKVHRFFVDLKNFEKAIELAPLSEKFKKISVLLEELVIKGNKSPK
jgi:hypothetical protein